MNKLYRTIVTLIFSAAIARAVEILDFTDFGNGKCEFAIDEPPSKYYLPDGTSDLSAKWWNVTLDFMKHINLTNIDMSQTVMGRVQQYAQLLDPNTSIDEIVIRPVNKPDKRVDIRPDVCGAFSNSIRMSICGYSEGFKSARSSCYNEKEGKCCISWASLVHLNLLIYRSTWEKCNWQCFETENEEICKRRTRAVPKTGLVDVCYFNKPEGCT
ncbi:hypothetical protein Kpol_1026p28 [Vanderwaltozyma polyspora DSM 70294]|uniref:Secreted protein n=1 Tax=Vanderwaltozyma polyspora (strain ATCC 22028 / DSM 70294 / BCRC 21397 / CBS 2163 / NBRC 10782 / NRRL Y-8283 / UCD 57-17) TaxID=436907 RepID=A7TNJ7_VANPO|nr:uncharacterized protein Kpol_1026p28 [Vanderwaltozyma polyspora DSM 70294]EDO16180.1 hypothetical protein Kpol_1026p28 [Vanderwaltozyma polyspora DSM 70294]